MLRRNGPPSVAAEERAQTTNERRDSHSLAFYATDGRRVGRLVADPDGRVFLEKRGLDPKRHMLRHPPAWATDAAHLEELAHRHGYGVRLFCTDGSVWTAPLSAFRDFGLDLDRGHGRQRALPESHWHRRVAGQLGLFDPGGPA